MVNLLNDIPLQSESKGKYDIYCQIKKQYHREKYFYKIHNNNIRKNITGIRCASIILPINALRKLNIKREFRICSLCSIQQLGTEMYGSLHCAPLSGNTPCLIFLWWGVLGYMVEIVELHGEECWVTWCRMLGYMVGSVELYGGEC